MLFAEVTRVVVLLGLCHFFFVMILGIRIVRCPFTPFQVTVSMYGRIL